MDGEPGGEDVRRWLGSALSGEPPLSIDRAEIVRQGRRRLRNRKLFQAGGAVSGVVAVVVGAVLVSGLVAENSTIPPAAESTRTAPGGTTDRPTSAQAPSTTQAPTSAPRSSEQAGPVNDLHTGKLTAAVVNPDVLPPSWKLAPVRGTNGPVFEKIHPSVYGLAADLYTAEGSGWLWVLVEKGPGVGATCDVIQEPVEECEVREELGMKMTIAMQRFDTGEIRRVVRSVRPDGCYVTVTSSNLTVAKRDEGVRPPKKSWPPLSESKMIDIAALPDLYIR